MNSLWTVIKFTLLNKLKGKASIISTVVLALIITVVMNIPFLIETFKGEDSPKNIGFIQAGVDEIGSVTGEQLLKYFETMENSQIIIKPYTTTGNVEDDEAILKKAIDSGEIDGYLQFGEVTDSGFPQITYKSKELLDYSTSSDIQAVLELIRQQRILAESGLTEEQVAQLNAPIEIKSVQIASSATGNTAEEGKSETQQGVNMGIIYFLIIFLFMAVMISGQMIASEVTAEKSSRVMEVLITSVSPMKSMFGKIFGMFLVVLVQLAIYIAVIMINLNLPHNVELLSSYSIDLSGVDPLLIIYALVYFLTGFFLFATLFAAIGSIVSRTEDLGQAIMPMTFVSLAGFYIAIFSIATPDSMLVKVSSFIPFLSPFVMILRIGLTDIATWEILLSIGILLATIYASVYLSAKIYRTGVLMYGKRPTWKEIRKAMKAYKI